VLFGAQLALSVQDVWVMPCLHQRLCDLELYVEGALAVDVLHRHDDAV
jgi:hypothetical protein